MAADDEVGDASRFSGAESAGEAGAAAEKGGRRGSSSSPAASATAASSTPRPPPRPRAAGARGTARHTWRVGAGEVSRAGHAEESGRDGVRGRLSRGLAAWAWLETKAKGQRRRFGVCRTACATRCSPKMVAAAATTATAEVVRRRKRRQRRRKAATTTCGGGGAMAGEETLQLADGTYVGNTRDGKAHGFGKQRFVGGDDYAWEFGRQTGWLWHHALRGRCTPQGGFARGLEHGEAR